MTQITTDEASVFDARGLVAIHDEIRDLYRQFPQPWVIGYSGGKDSTTVLQLIWNALAEQSALSGNSNFTKPLQLQLL